MDNDSNKQSNTSNNSSSSHLVRIQIVDPIVEEDLTPELSFNDEIDNEVTREFANVEISQEEFYKRIQDVGCTK